MLVVYCLRNTDIISAPHGLPEFAAVAFTAALHVWRRNMLLSAAGVQMYTFRFCILWDKA